MPGGDRTGPLGLGPRTGRNLGFCAGYDTPGYTKGPGMGLGRRFYRGRGYGSGIGRGQFRSWGRGYGGMFYYGAPYYNHTFIPPSSLVSPVASTDQLNMFKQEKEYLESELKTIQDAISEVSKRIEELEKIE